MNTVEQDRYRTVEVMEMTGATYRQLDYWSRRGLIPGMEIVTGSGHRRAWAPEQLERVRLLLQASELVNLTLDEAVELLTHDR